MLRPDLMEEGEANAVVGAILWMAQTILETLLPTGELDAWLRRVGLAGAIGELKSEVERMETVANGVKGRAVGNKPLARSLARVKELMYDADDVVDELDYCRLQHKVQGVAIEPEGLVGIGNRAEQADRPPSNTGTPNISGRKNRSEARDYFHITPALNGEPARAKCIDCCTQVVFSHGTSVLFKHRNSASCKKKRAVTEAAPDCPSASDNVQNAPIISSGDSDGRKKIKIATTHLWDTAEFFKRIQEIAVELRSVRGNVIEYLKDSVASPDQYHSNTSDTRVRTSGSHPRRLYGRDTEKHYIISVIKAAESNNITVLPIVGIVGVGKTALAKLVYHDPHVEREFERVWVWVSSIFDEVRVTREILDVVTLARHEGSCNRESYEGVSNYSKLLGLLKQYMSCLSKRFLVVLDDVCDCMDNSQWKDLMDALGSSCLKGNVIIVTTRNLSIAKRLGTVKPFELEALGNYDFWILFKACAFGDNNSKEHLDIGRQISAKLKGNPLAAKSAAEMLREQPTLGHWKSIIRNGVWESLQLRGGIVTTLKINYYQLPYQLQQCFLFCSIFPDNHQFYIDDLVSMWISLGFVKSIEIGQDYFNSLVNSCLLEEVQTEDSFLLKKRCYVMCGMVREFARLISRTEFASIYDLEREEVLPSVRHFLILTDLVYHKDECGIISSNVKFEEKWQSIVSSARRLRTFILIGNYSSLLFKYFYSFMCNSVNCTHLRYLKLENKGSEALPISLRKFYHLEVLDARCQAVVHGMSDLISMRHLVLTNGASSRARFACLQRIHVEDCEGWEILPSLEGLSSLTKLKLRNMPQVTELLIPSLEELVLIDMPKLDTCFFNSVRDLNSSLRVLEIRRCLVLNTFPLFESCEKFEIEQKSWLPNVSKLIIHECPCLMVSNPLPPSSSFCKLSITKISTLPNMRGSTNGEFTIGPENLGHPYYIALILDDKILSFHNLRTITQMQIVHCKNLWSISLEGFRQLINLKSLQILSCKIFISSDVPSDDSHECMTDTNFDALPSLECLTITSCEIIGQWLSVMLQHVRALDKLHLVHCQQISGLLIQGKEKILSNLTSAQRASSQGNPNCALTRPCPKKLLSIPSNLIPSLKKMDIQYCKATFLGNMEGFSGFTSLEELTIVECPKLISSLVHEDEIEDQAKGRWLLPCSLRVLDVRGASLGTLQPCFPGDLTCLTVLRVSEISGLKSLNLHSCKALEMLEIICCRSLDTLEGVHSLRGLRYLQLYVCPGLPQCLKSLSTQGYELCPRLERLWIDDHSFLTMSFCKHLTSLQHLKFKSCSVFAEYRNNVPGRTGKQETPLQLLTSLQQLGFEDCYDFLPHVSLHSLLSLKRLEIINCPRITRLPRRGLPPSLEELEASGCSKELTAECKMLATSKLKVIIDREYVN